MNTSKMLIKNFLSVQILRDNLKLVAVSLDAQTIFFAFLICNISLVKVLGVKID